jgi:hypothetical protein
VPPWRPIQSTSSRAVDTGRLGGTISARQEVPTRVSGWKSRIGSKAMFGKNTRFDACVLCVPKTTV